MFPRLYLSGARPTIDARMARRVIATTLAGVLVFLSSTFASADTLVPVVDTGGGGGGGGSVAIFDMLRGDYSPIAVSQEIAVTEVQGTVDVAEMLRGGLSPIAIDIV